VTFSSKAQVDAVVAHAFAVQSLAHTHLRHQVCGELFEYSSAHAVDDVVLIAALQDHRIDTLQVQQVSQQKTRRPRPNNSYLSLHAIPVHSGLAKFSPWKQEVILLE